MKVLVVYDSVNKNTEAIARAVAQALGAEARSISAVDHSALAKLDLLVIGSPTYGGRSTKPMQAFLASLSPKGMNVALFDTRLEAAWVKVFGFAADKMAKDLSARGAKVAGAPAGFFVKASGGPLKEGEVERAAAWAKGLAAAS